MDTGWVLVSVLIFCRKVSKSVVLSVRFPSFSLSWVDFHFLFLFCHMQAKWFAYSVLRYDNQALFASDSMLF